MLIKSNNNYKDKISYGGGLTKPMIADIRSTDVSRVQNYFAHNNINTEFQNNRFIAWASVRVFEILKSFQENFGLKLGFPTNILVKDVNSLNLPNLENTYGFCNLVPSKIHKNSDEITPAKSIIFNKNFPWHNINEISDFDFYTTQNSSTDFFLESVFHEFGHIIHEDHLLQNFNINTVLEKLISLTMPKTVEHYQDTYGSLVEKEICRYAKNEPLDLIACDMSKRFIDNIDLNSLLTNGNPFKNSPYERFYTLRSLFKDKTPITSLIRQIYQGKIPTTD